MMRSKRLPGLPKQVGVIPYRWKGRKLQVLLVTSRTRGRWIVPKGNLEPDRSAKESARLEAWEEAGVRGKINPIALGAYPHGEPPEAMVHLYMMRVEEIESRWPERDEREREWMSIKKARKRIDERGVKRLLPLMEELLH